MKQVEFIKFRHRNETIWLLVTKETKKYYYGIVDNTPIYKGLKYGQRKRILKTKIFDILYK